MHILRFKTLECLQIPTYSHCVWWVQIRLSICVSILIHICAYVSKIYKYVLEYIYMNLKIFEYFKLYIYIHKFLYLRAYLFMFQEGYVSIKIWMNLQKRIVLKKRVVISVYLWCLELSIHLDKVHLHIVENILRK